jgi:hypothetical protein
MSETFALAAFTTMDFGLSTGIVDLSFDSVVLIVSNLDGWFLAFGFRHLSADHSAKIRWRTNQRVGSQINNNDGLADGSQAISFQ